MLTLEPRRGNRKLRIPAPVIKTLISIVVLLVLMVGGGVGYVWYMGRYGAKNPNAFANPVEVKPKTEIKHPPIDPKAPVGASVQSITAVSPGDNASITVRTTPEAECMIVVEYNKVPSKDSGLVKKIADDDGLVSWTWTVEDTVPLGKWPVKVTCTHHDKSGFVQGDLEVAKPVTN